jgi:hypothetical protein
MQSILKINRIKMKRPTSNISEILFTLIRNRKVSFIDFAYMQGFRTRVSELKTDHGLNLKTDRVQSKNKFNNPYTFVVHSLPQSERSKAVEIYNKLVN